MKRLMISAVIAAAAGLGAVAAVTTATLRLTHRGLGEHEELNIQVDPRTGYVKRPSKRDASAK